jgi:tripeptide aminopeptidase
MTVIQFSSSDQKELLERFLRYVEVDTQSDEGSSSSPSTEKQKDLARMLLQELHDLGCDSAEMDEWGYVYAKIPSNLPSDHPASGKVPAVGLIAHVDTYHATPGAGVKPQLHRSYAGGDIELPGAPDKTITVAENPNLAKCVGDTIITSDGTTLLGADDKAGVAEIMTVVSWLAQHPEVLHGPVHIAFTTDEEIGRGTEHFDVERFGARYAYTLDGADLGEIEDETFCADTATVTVEGHDVHPGYAKGKLVNAVRVASAIVERVPGDFLPETTSDRDPYLHPFTFEGDVSKVVVRFLVRAFTEDELHEREHALRDVVDEVSRLYPKAGISVDISESYRNMRYKIAEDPKVLEYAMEAIERQQITPIRRAIRGGTDGARLSFMGVLTPNLWAGGQSFHSVQEWAPLSWMVKASETAVQILNVWVEHAVAGR